MSFWPWYWNSGHSCWKPGDHGDQCSRGVSKIRQKFRKVCQTVLWRFCSAAQALGSSDIIQLFAIINNCGLKPSNPLHLQITCFTLFPSSLLECQNIGRVSQLFASYFPACLWINYYIRAALLFNLSTVRSIFKMNMKKRSQSSLRAKTMQSEEDVHEDPNYWIGNMQTKSILSKVGHKITSSLFLDGNKENLGTNTPPIYQSLANSKSQEFARDHLVFALQEKCKDYEKQLSEVYKNRIQEGRDDQMPNSQPNRIFNYTEQYYEKEIAALKDQIHEQNRQLSKYQEMYSSKQDEVSGLNSGMSSRIQKQQNEKNLLIKQINTNTIEIKRLRQELGLYKSSKQTLNLVLKEKQATIEELRESIGLVENQKKKIESYELQFRETQAAIKQIEAQTQKIRQDNRRKDATIGTSNQKIMSLEQKLAAYEQEVKQLEKSVITLKESSSSTSKNIVEVEQECESWKEKYYTVKQELETIPQLQIKLKNSCSTIEDLRSRIKELISTNEKLKIDLGNHQSLKKKVSEFEQEKNKYKRIIQQKDEQILQIQQNKQHLKEFQQRIQSINIKNAELQKRMSDREQELRKVNHQLNEKQLRVTSLQDQLDQIVKEKSRIKERQEKIDTLYSENKSLRDSLFEKIAEIEELQRKINIMESKNAGLSNENKKIQAILDSTSEQLNVMESNFENMKNRWETEMGAKLGMQEKCTRFSKDISAMKSNIVGLQSRNQELTQLYEQKMREFQQKKDELYQQLEELAQQKVEADESLQMSKDKIDEMKEEVGKMQQFLNEQLEKERRNLLKIREMEGNVIQLTEQLNQSKRVVKQTRQLWRTVSECSTKALASLE